METTLPLIAKELRTLDRSDVRAWLRRGELLTQARGLCQGDRDFAAWLRSTDTPRRNAYRAMAAFRDFATVPNPAHFTRDAMDLLSRCDAARAAALELSHKQRITARVARTLLREHDITAQSPKKEEGGTTGPVKEIIIGEGFKVTFTFDKTPTHADLLGALTHAGRVLREKMLPSSKVAA